MNPLRQYQTILRQMNRWHWLLVVSVITTLIGFMYFFQDDSFDPDPLISHYTCPMHPEIKSDRPGSCPICHMDLVPVKKESQASDAAKVRVEVAGRSFAIDPERQQLIGVRTVKVERRPLRKLIRTSGRVAFDPELAVAIREYLSVLGSAELSRAAGARLRLLGMGEEELRNLSRNRALYNNLTDVREGGPVWIYANLYEQDLEHVRSGMQAEVVPAHSREDPLVGVIRSIAPVVEADSRSIIARIYLEKSGPALRPDASVDVLIKVDRGEDLAIPRSAILDSGAEQVVFVVHDGRHFEARSIRIGEEVGEDVVVRSGLNEGETVVSRATFLVDSESRLRGVRDDFSHNH
ncbi:MAG: efflux RND transporter periplasmic adaptor subunit [Spirochaetales bacterium]|nr:efflux RND transporter periplasmic adaptor subunit [Spirochaetales bacterium]